MRINDRAPMSSGSINDLPDSAFAYIEPGGTKDSSGKTTPRSLRHFPIHDAAHVRNALARLSQSPFGSKAAGKVHAAATKFGIDTNRSQRQFFALARASEVAVEDVNPPKESLAGQYEPANVEELQSMIAELASEPSIHQNSNVSPIRDILDKLKAAAKRLNAEALIPPTWHASGTVLAPRASSGIPEMRYFSINEVRDASDGLVTLSGYASTFNDPYPVRDNLGPFEETILPGAWAKAISNRDAAIHLLIAHNRESIPLAATPNSLRMWEDSHGLGYEADLEPTQSNTHKEVAYAVRTGRMNQMSVGMRVPDGGDRWSDSNTKRVISEAQLIEISVLPRGANPNTEAMVREEAILAEIRTLRESLTAHTGISLDAAQRMLAARYQQNASDNARRALLDALKF